MGAFVYNPLKFIAELPPDSEAVQQILEHILSTRNNVTLAGLQSELQQEGFYELEALVGTIAETLLKQGEERGLAMGEKRGLAEGVERGQAEGVKRGLAKGREQGKAETLARLLERRFGALPGNIRRRLASAEPAQVESWLEAFQDAPDLAAVFAAERTR